MNDEVKVLVGNLWHPDWTWVEGSGWHLSATLTPEFAAAVRRENPELFEPKHTAWDDEDGDE